MRTIIATALLGLAAACSPAPVPTATSSVAQTAPASASVPSITPVPSPSPEQAAWLPPWAGPATPAQVVTRSVLPFCGVEEGGFAGLINAQVRGCFATALRDGGAAEFANIRSTIEGDPIATITRALPGGGLEILVDSTQDAFGARVWTRAICRGFTENAEFGFTAADCDEEIVIR